MHRESIHVLLVEDNASDAALLQAQLSAYAPGEFQITVVDEMSRAEERLAAQSFDAALLNLSLKTSQGNESLRRMKSAAPHVPIVVMSGVRDEDIALSAVQNGAQDYLVKGVADGHVIARVIRYATERKRSEEALHRAHALLEQRVMERTAFLKVTNRRLHDEIAERERAEVVLRKERDFSSAIFDTVGAIVVVLDDAGRVMRCNRSCEQATGYAEREIRGLPIWDVFLAPQDVERVQLVFEGLLDLKRSNRYENGWLTKDGRQLLIDWSNTVILDADGNVEHVIATGIDITEKRHAEELERQRLQELAHVSRLTTMGQMATEIAHELNQPLCAIASYSDTCLRMYASGKCEPSEVRGILTEIGQQAERASEVIKRIRKFVRKEDAERVAIDINELVQDVVRLTQMEARRYQVLVRADLSEGLAPVVVDKILIEQVILNLVRNAIEAIATAESPTRTVNISTGTLRENVLHVIVQDTGPGLPQDSIDKIFTPFYTTKTQGMGLGLSLSLSIVEAHRGRLTHEPAVGNGATFRLELPAYQKEGD